MKTEIWKYELTSKYTDLEIPHGGEILCVQRQNKKTFIWVEVYPEAKKEIRSIIIVATGESITNGQYSNKRYIGTFQLQQGIFVYHVFEIFSVTIPQYQ